MNGNVVNLAPDTIYNPLRKEHTEDISLNIFMATLNTTTAKTDNIDGSIKHAYRDPKPAGIVHCPHCAGSGSIHTSVCEACEGDGHVLSKSVEETNEAEKKAAEDKLKKDIEAMKDGSGAEGVRENRTTEKTQKTTKRTRKS